MLDETQQPSEEEVKEPKPDSNDIGTAQAVFDEQKVKGAKPTNTPKQENKTKPRKQGTDKVHTSKQNGKQTKDTKSTVIDLPPATNKQHNSSNVQTTPGIAIRLSTAVRNNIKVGAVVAVVLGIGGWYFNQCINDRKQHLTDFMEIVNKRRAAQEKEIQSLTAMIALVDRFVDYLSQKPITVSEIEKQQDHIASLAGTANDDCNTFKELNYKYQTSKEILHRDLQKPPPIMPPGAYHQCELLARMAAKSDIPDAQKLFLDEKYRENYIAEVRGTDVSILKGLDRMLSSERTSENDLITEAQIRDSNIIKRVWNCLSS